MLRQLWSQTLVLPENILKADGAYSSAMLNEIQENYFEEEE